MAKRLTGRFCCSGDPKTGVDVDFLSPAAKKAGVHRGDTLVAVNGKRVTGTAVYGEALARAHVGDTLRITFRTRQPDQPTAERTADVVLEKSSRNVVVTLALLVALPVFCIALGFWVAFVRPRDALAWLLLALLLSFAASPTPSTESWGPGIRDAATIYHTALSSTLVIWMMLFGIYFPERFPAKLRWRWWDWLKWALGVPLAFAALADVILNVGKLENYATVAALDRLLTPMERPFEVCGFAAVTCFFASIGTKYRLAVSEDSKRRLRLLYFGAVVCFTPLLILILVGTINHTQVEEYFPWWASLIAYGLMSLFPVLVAYLIVVHRSMDVRVVVRQGLQYALATGGIRVLQILVGVGSGIFVLDFVLKRVGPHTLVYYGVIAVWIALVLGLRRIFQRLKGWTDRRFFRDAYNAEQNPE